MISMCLEHLLRAIAVAISGEPFELRPWVPRHCVCETRREPALLLEYGFMIDESVVRPLSGHSRGLRCGARVELLDETGHFCVG